VRRSPPGRPRLPRAERLRSRQPVSTGGSRDVTDCCGHIAGRLADVRGPAVRRLDGTGRGRGSTSGSAGRSPHLRRLRVPRGRRPGGRRRAVRDRCHPCSGRGQPTPRRHPCPPPRPRRSPDRRRRRRRAPFIRVARGRGRALGRPVLTRRPSGARCLLARFTVGGHVLVDGVIGPLRPGGLARVRLWLRLVGGPGELRAEVARLRLVRPAGLGARRSSRGDAELGAGADGGRGQLRGQDRG
jgi:hypothetical protein